MVRDRVVRDGAAGRPRLGPLLRALRRRARLSQRQLAERAGVPASTVARIEAGRTPDPRYRTVECLVNATGGRLLAVDAVGEVMDAAGDGPAAGVRPDAPDQGSMP